MKVKTVVENENGVFEFSAELSEQQHAFLLEYAIRDLIRKGLIPFMTSEEEALKPTTKDSEIQLN